MKLSTTQDLVVENRINVRKELKTLCVMQFVKSTQNCIKCQKNFNLLEIKRKEAVRINCILLTSSKQTTRRGIFDDNERFIG